MLSDETIIRDGNYSLPRRVVLTIRKKASSNYRDTLNNSIREILHDTPPFTIFANNCIGGVFYHDAGRQFTSPLINTAMDAEDFLTFLENPKKYLALEPEFFNWPGRNFPIARLGDIEVNFVHYKTEEECLEKWNTRKSRIVWDNIFIVTTDQDGMCHSDCMERFNKLPYKNKIMFVSKEHPEYDWAKPIRQFNGRYQCRITTAFADMYGHRYYETAFDIPRWIKNNSKQCNRDTKL